MKRYHKNLLHVIVACLVLAVAFAVSGVGERHNNGSLDISAGQRLETVEGSSSNSESSQADEHEASEGAVDGKDVGAKAEAALTAPPAGYVYTDEDAIEAGNKLVVEDAPPYEPQVVLLSVADGATVQEINQLIAQSQSLAPREVRADELKDGVIKLAVAKDASVEGAVSELATSHVAHAQPDYIYYALEANEGTSHSQFAATLYEHANDVLYSGEKSDQKASAPSLKKDSSQEAVRTDESSATAEVEEIEYEADGNHYAEDDASTDIADEEMAPDSEDEPLDDDGSTRSEDGREVESPSAADNESEDMESLAELLDPVSVNDSYTNEQWALTRMKMFEAWAYARCEGTVGIAVFDEGPDATHEDLAHNVVDAYDSYTQSETPGLVLDHGTHVAGIVGAVADNSMGVAGISYNAKLSLHNVFYTSTNSSGTTRYVTNTSTLIRAYTYLADHQDTLGVRVVNLSLGVKKNSKSTYSDDALVSCINEMFEKGIVTVAAAGNSELGTIPYYEYPGDAPNVVSVMNLRQTKTGVELSSESNHNVDGQTDKNICAPGTSIISTTPGDMYSVMSGTSMAAPHVSGVLALEFAANPSLTAQEAVTILYATAHDLGEDGWDELYGWGEVDAAAAVKAAKEGAQVELPDISDHEIPEPIVTGPTRIPVGATAQFEVVHGSLSIKSGKSQAVLEGTTLTGMAEGMVTLSVIDEAGVEQATRNVVIYDTAGCWVLQPFESAPYVLDVKGGSVLNSANAQVYTSNNKMNQVWLLEPQTDGSFEVRSAKSGKVLDVAGASTKSGANVIQYKRSGKAWQRWKMSVNANNSVTLVNDHSAMALEVAKQASNSVNVRQGAVTGSANQQWVLKSVTADVGPIWDGVYKLTTSINKAYALDVKRASAENGGNVQLYRSNGDDNQQWRFEHLGKGVYKIVNVHSGKVLDVARGTLKNSVNIDQWSWNGGSNQRWELEAFNDGSYAILRAGTTWAVDVKGAVAENARNVHQYQYKANKAQRWFLTQY